MPEQGTLEVIARELVNALRPLQNAVASEDNFKRFIYRLGWNVNSLPPSYIALGAKVGDAVISVEALVTDPTIDEVIDILMDIKDIYESIKNLTEAPVGVDASVFLPELTGRLFELLLNDYLAYSLPQAYNYLQLFGVIKYESIAAQGDRPSFIIPKIQWEEFPKIITEPETLPERVFGWGTPNLKSELIFTLLSELINVLGLPVSVVKVEEGLANAYQTPGNESERINYKIKVPFYYLNIGGEVAEFSIDIIELPGQGAKLAGLIIQPNIPSEVGVELRLSEAVNLRLRAGSNIASLFGLVIRPNEFTVKYPFSDGNTLPEAGFGMGFDFDPSEPAIIFGAPNDIRLQVKGVSVGFAFNLVIGEEPEVILKAGLRELALVLAAGNSDGFLKTLLGDGETKMDFSMEVEWSNKNGVKFVGGGGFEIAIHPHLTLGPISIEDILIRLLAEVAPDPKIKLEAGANIKAALGPLTVVVQNIGVSLNAVFQEGSSSGPFGLQLGFRPPNGVGLSIDASMIKGGGFLFLDFDKGEYMGALELDVKGMFSLKAIGIINTKMPNGSDGFSLLIIITAEFTPIQLGFGFTLNGVGGLLGLNRTARIDVLREGIKTNAIKSILFPQDIVANINRIISDVKQVFPIQQDRFLIGPMVKIGWGTPSIITLELGLILEIPVPRIIILGVIKIVLPEESSAVIKIQVNFLGIIDFENKYISFDASLYDSRLLAFTLTGDMAFRLSWGENSVFILSVGGFHPAFLEAPQDLQNMTRLTISLLSGENPRICIQAYFAITSNTVQLGAKVELYAEAAGFNIYGYLGFDILFQFEPFKFIAALYAGLALRRGTSVIMGIRVSGQLMGPTPWDAQGEASFKILFFEVTVSFHETWGDKPNELDKEKEDLLLLLTKEVNDIRNWKAEIPTNNNLFVTIKKLEQPDDKLIIHPFGLLTFSERLLPLEFNLEKFGNKLPKDAHRFELKDVKSGSQTLPIQPITEQFAPEQFIELTDSEKLARPSFERMKSGFKVIPTNGLTIATGVSKSVDYEFSYLKKKRFSFILAGIYKYAFTLFQTVIKGSAVSKSSLSYQNTRISVNAPEEVLIQPEQFAIANVNDMKLHKTTLVANSYTEAAQLYQELLVENPELKNSVQVVSYYELNLN